MLFNYFDPKPSDLTMARLKRIVVFALTQVYIIMLNRKVELVSVARE